MAYVAEGDAAHIRILEEQVKRCFTRLKGDEFTPLQRMLEYRLERLLDTLKKSNDINAIRWVQGQVVVYEWFLDNIKRS